jgi:cleavage stimulation factor subunit 3
LIERYKVFDLWPCGKEELKSYGFEEATAKISNSRTAQESQELRIASLGKTKKRATIATPDISQMTPFKPTVRYHPGEHRVPGGVFPMPPLLGDFCNRLPPPGCFDGPFVKIDSLLSAMNLLPSSLHENADNKNNHEKKEPSTNNKRKQSHEVVSDNEDEEDVPTNDLYRKRQQRKIR